MDSTDRDLTHAVKEIDIDTEKQSLPLAMDNAVQAKHTVDEKQGKDTDSGTSSENGQELKQLDSQIVDVPVVKEGDEAYAHLPPHEQEIIKRQLDIPPVAVTYKTLFRYATRIDILIIIISLICSIGGGAVQPLMTVGDICLRVGDIMAEFGQRSYSVNWPQLSRITLMVRSSGINSTKIWRILPCISCTWQLGSLQPFTFVPSVSFIRESI